ncbi:MULTISPECIES: AAA family ATPase [Sphaerospermopsis]|uniref:AAA family ATPase n=2 Tax=Sphaerospermopsis TaxID=752201 RepID=A0ABR9VCX9_9CYAN|nr:MULTISPECIES: AAA family ATPase [Sphaerospermopsis]MBD2131955.1 AAA family ATPase [Sphaerospermopsis sp. FACHB-1094]MBD2146803.1 AAA family ATPase [Sphaerospermopsis sp. FACHB-1194]MBE9236339.1 AAA family ATPase [Sphaerospermopsis aphanizomenoides LEGE 00250]GCL38250.1 putative ATP/GTP-binding protein [Sphaerospermopsis reniformis]
MLLSEHLNFSNLKSFSINGLFGYKDMKIPFDKEAVILIAENGSGKTTILNALYYSISCKFSRLITIDFESVVLEFASGVSVEIKKSDLTASALIETFNSVAFRDVSMAGNITGNIIIPATTIKGFARTMIEQNSINIKKNIRENLHESILYFPTYRRIEEELKNLGNEELNFGKEDERLIQFGMDDVIAKFDRIEKNIKDATLELLPKVNGEMLTQFVEVTTPTQEMRDSIQPETLNIVLNKIGNNIPENDKNKIEELVNSGKIKSPEYNQLVYYLSKLLGLYEPQREKDNSIKKFAEVCNKYLHKKRIVYDETSVEISIVQEKNHQPIDIRNLSSGEKQIISLFSKIYLDSDDEYIILFDEPELSLSLEWQRLLLPDILKSGKCKLLLAVTHSPFIFDNELDTNAIDLDDFVTEK